ncbi:polymorphic toxin-type HINT domain-containing protein [Undibacterium sp. Ji50W]|uniref:polymorphic toxin-type HINT domain-containing protein n=1 Tax=Undibacterium sp. Ji50W TaxID=3413041 RepID=UPI003BEFC12C
MTRARLPIAQTRANTETANEAACFIYDTYVQMRCGHVEIQFISPGDEVLSRCESTGEIAYRKVAKTFTREKKQIYGLGYITLDGREFGEGTTGEHPFWVKDVGWTEVRNLQPGNVIETYDDNAVKITSVKKNRSLLYCLQSGSRGISHLLCR